MIERCIRRRASVLPERSRGVFVLLRIHTDQRRASSLDSARDLLGQNGDRLPGSIKPERGGDGSARWPL